MDNGLIPHRYAKALYEFALERHDQTALYDAMKAVIDNFEAVPGLQKAMANPFMPKEEKEKLILQAAGSPAADKGGATLAAFVKLLAKNNRLDLVMGGSGLPRHLPRGKLDLPRHHHLGNAPR